jgi:hypothetical protein
MKTRATEENILKYYNALKDLNVILKSTKVLSMLRFSEQRNLTKSLSTVLQRGKVIKLLKKGKYSEWEWTTIEPTRDMAIKVLQELSSLNPPRKVGRPRKLVSQSKTNTIKIKSKEKTIVGYKVNLLFGLIKLNVKPIYK